MVFVRGKGVEEGVTGGGRVQGLGGELGRRVREDGGRKKTGFFQF